MVVTQYETLETRITANQSIGLIAPQNGQTVRGDVNVLALAMRPAFAKWQLDLLLDEEEGCATFIALGRRPTWGTLTTFDSTRYPTGRHRLRLRIVREDANYDEYFASIMIAN